MLTYDQQYDLVNRGLAKASIDEENQLVTFKYARKVMYDYLWNKHPELLECRGHVYCMVTKKLVVAPPTKTFNYLENGTWANVPMNSSVFMYKKYNGFLANATVHNGKLVVSTTGTTTSDYAKLARKVIDDHDATDNILECDIENITWSFEICHKSDPHIVNEVEELYYLGYRQPDMVHSFIAAGEFMVKTLQEALEYVQSDEGEGYMVYLNNGRCCKLKTPYYAGKKKLMRMNKHQVEKMYNTGTRQNVVDSLPDRWKYVVKYIVEQHTQDQWLDKTDQERRAFLEIIQNSCTK